MTTIRRASIGAGLATALTLVLAACGSGATPVPSATAGPSLTGSPTTSAAPAASPTSSIPGSQTPAGSAPTGTGVFGTAAEKLSSLTSYRFTVKVDTSSAAGTRKISMAGTVVNSPGKAYALQMDDGGTLQTSMVVIGEGAWMRQGTGAWQQVSAAMAQTLLAGVAAFRPETLFASAFGANGDKFSVVGEESRNGTPSTQYRGSDALSGVYGGMFGVSASFASDVWIARDGGYLVASEIRTTGATASASGSYSSVVDITNVNDPANRVEQPS